ncbi:CD151 antigen [Monomorium pharaonis]|uniref:CD151 antigen n=1 Tax=Monomorium pharaonis TaxID=307658 RepID=UPI00063F66BD|nr:CD151 antigen [Monomorium pharaonis]
MNRCGRFIKYSLIATNSIIFCYGILVTIISIWFLISKSSIQELKLENVNKVFYIALISGIIIIFIAVLGIVGALQEAKCKLLIYIIIISLFFVMTIISGILHYKNEDTSKENLETLLQKMIAYSDYKLFHDMWDLIQSAYHCCGIYSWKDWAMYNFNVPESCCQENELGQRFYCNADPSNINTSEVYTMGCINEIQNFMQHNATITRSINIVCGCITFCGMITSIAFFLKIKKPNNKMHKLTYKKEQESNECPKYLEDSHSFTNRLSYLSP